jgi:hypothetical protein
LVVHSTEPVDLVELQVNFESNGSFADVRLASGLLQEARHMHYSLHLPPKKPGISHLPKEGFKVSLRSSFSG